MEILLLNKLFSDYFNGIELRIVSLFYKESFDWEMIVQYWCVNPVDIVKSKIMIVDFNEFLFYS